MLRNLIFWLSTKRAITAAIARTGMRYGFARRFVAGETLPDALAAGRELAATGRKLSLNHLGENVATAEEARRARDNYLAMLRELEETRLDGNISVKLTQLGLDFDRDLCRELTAELARAAGDRGLTIELDMEGSAYTAATVELFSALRRSSENVGLAIQAYLYRSAEDLERLAPLAPKIRLVKGAYREPAGIAYQRKRDVDANYLRLLDRLLQGGFFPAIATHDPAIHRHALERVREKKLDSRRYEFQMIYGVRRDLQEALGAAGQPLRIYVPFGEQWCPYFMRRLAERPANCWFVARSLAAEALVPNQRR
jgi:proline dehydrogenase